MSFGDIDIIHGEIFDNIFSVKPVNTQVVQWCLIPKNEQNIRRRLNYFIEKKNLYSANIDTLFVFVLDYFSRPNKEFYKNYSGGEDYTIEKYVFSNLKYIFNIYRSDILKSTNINDTAISYSNTDFSDTYSRLDKILAIEQEEIEEVDYNLILDLVNTLEMYLIKKKYNVDLFGDLNKLVMTLFISPISDNIEDNNNYVSKTLNIPVDTLETLQSDLKKDFISGYALSIDLFNKLKHIISNKRM